MEVPGGTHTDVVVAVAVPVVDVQPVLVEVADYRRVLVRAGKFARFHLWHRTLRFTAGCANAYTLSVLNFIWEQYSREHISTRSEQEVNPYP